ncbi:uroporphyrinogen-III C-methyltransferase [Sphingomonas sp. IC-11]|uniref:uroporphyrinogen-III C-methyltransferase n=1 Tax=Sphingomonas sp. IC-11 TaxID=2898528 RepID=UPI001E32DB3F|nr:uroporphyrinogen-III C-methyltransferase [Sphingomonas sp. IC-11]MCD2317285.1 uroporphyrinogen-III C-methyltransferase [Sphingomonas sp. IC-11]
MLHEDFPPGSVWLVGAGPGDPELLTRKAERLIAAADVVFHDALVGAGVLDLIPASAERISVGKRSGRHSKDQAAIDALIVAAAKAGKRVTRLKGGDPAIFGRTAEEVAACTKAGVRVRICPGVTAASAATAAAGLSLTLRDSARQVTFVTAHARAGVALDLDWQALASSATTLAIYMGRAAAGLVAQQLMASGRSADTPVLVVVNASLPSERLIRGKLSSLAFLVETVGHHDPTMLIVGEAVRPSDPLARGDMLRHWPQRHRVEP